MKNVKGELETVFFPAPATCLFTENRPFVVKKLKTMLHELRSTDARNARQRLENLVEKTQDFVSVHDRQQNFETNNFLRVLQVSGRDKRSTF
jgi:hypothetical protein